MESEYAGYQLLVIYNTNQGKHLFIYIYILYAKRNKEKNFIVVATILCLFFFFFSFNKHKCPSNVLAQHYKKMVSHYLKN